MDSALLFAERCLIGIADLVTDNTCPAMMLDGIPEAFEGPISAHALSELDVLRHVLCIQQVNGQPRFERRLPVRSGQAGKTRHIARARVSLTGKLAKACLAMLHPCDHAHHALMGGLKRPTISHRDCVDGVEERHRHHAVERNGRGFTNFHVICILGAKKEQSTILVDYYLNIARLMQENATQCS